MNDQIQNYEEVELAALAEDSRARAPARPESAERVETSIADVLRAAERAHAAQIAAGIDPEPEHKARGQQLISTLERLPYVIRSASRAELTARIAPRLLDAVSAWQWGSGNLVLSGRTRAGKSSAAGFLVRRLCQEAARHGGESFELAKAIRWQECRELSEAAREHRLGGGAAPEITLCSYARLLVLDDLGAADDRKTLERILQFRIDRAWPTITTTGLPADGPEGIVKTFGEALSARIFECGPHKGKLVEVFE